MRDELDLAPAERLAASTPLEFRARRRDGGLVVRHDEAAVGWLATPDLSSWAAVAFDAENSWRFAPEGRRHPPDLVAYAVLIQISEFGPLTAMAGARPLGT